MRLWFMDEGKYPSGLAGGKFTTERPELCMKALAEPERVSVAAGRTFSRALETNVICAVAVNRASSAAQALEPKAGRVNWIAPAGDWEVVLVHSVFRSGPTRSANTPTAAKDDTHSLMDYLDPAATQLFKEWTFEGYRKPPIEALPILTNMTRPPKSTTSGTKPRSRNRWNTRGEGQRRRR